MTKAQDIDRRKARVRDLYLIARLKPKDITERLLAEGVMRAKSFDSAYRLIRADVEELRTELEADQVLAMGDPVERARYVADMIRLRDHAWSQMLQAEAVTKSQTKMQNGDVIATIKKADRGGNNSKWAGIYAEACKQIAIANGVDLRATEDGDRPHDGDEATAGTEFQFNFSGKTLPDLIRSRTGQGEVN